MFIAAVFITSIHNAIFYGLEDRDESAITATVLYYISDQFVYWWVIWMCYAMSWRVASNLKHDPILIAQYGRNHYGYTSGGGGISVRSVTPSTPTKSKSVSSSWFTRSDTKSVPIQRGDTNHSTASTTAEALKRITVDDVLRNNEMVEAFMAHLSNEFSLELLLSLIEFKQFKAFAENERDSI